MGLACLHASIGSDARSSCFLSLPARGKRTGRGMRTGGGRRQVQRHQLYPSLPPPPLSICVPLHSTHSPGRPSPLRPCSCARATFLARVAARPRHRACSRRRACPRGSLLAPAR
uniref:Uncharacterized protein n=1 Tax=Arundo donax TaxID=35708 RepID=A0A0A8YGK2_ARUDO